MNRGIVDSITIDIAKRFVQISDSDDHKGQSLDAHCHAIGLARWPSIFAKVRLRVRLFGHPRACGALRIEMKSGLENKHLCRNTPAFQNRMTQAPTWGQCQRGLGYT